MFKKGSLIQTRLKSHPLEQIHRCPTGWDDRFEWGTAGNARLEPFQSLLVQVPFFKALLHKYNQQEILFRHMGLAPGLTYCYVWHCVLVNLFRINSYSIPIPMSRPILIFILFQIIPIRLLMNNIKQRLRAKPTCHWRSDRFISKLRVSIIDLHRFSSTSSRCGISEKLSVAALVQTHKPKYCLLDRSSDS